MRKDNLLKYMERYTPEMLGGAHMLQKPMKSKFSGVYPCFGRGCMVKQPKKDKSLSGILKGFGEWLLG